ncbi:3-methyl-2-oxobutanoate dehydrogenase subunit VorB [candidate division NPL-UPA2 bacterium]|nr:3-methyl-2-oxobutanoate dehydrogenase subunit VorB [candidate division NPL-UPA2 bacterium]
MSKKVLMCGNEALGEAAIQANCRHYFGYPITPQNELTAYMAKRLPEVGGVFLQSESEVAAINMVYGAAATGVRAMTSTSSPGMSLKQEGISYLAGAELPAVIVNIVRGGPGLGNIAPAQSDYFQATRGGGHGDYRTIVLAPSMVQEMADLTHLAFDLADRYRNPVIILGDGLLGQMMEPIEIKPKTQNPKLKTQKPWALTGARGRPRNLIRSLYLGDKVLERHNQRLQERYKKIFREEVHYEAVSLEDAEIVLVAYGTSARMSRAALVRARKEGLKVGLLRPITLWPFPSDMLAEIATRARTFLVVEMSAGQMIEDVRLSVEGKRPVHFYGRMGGEVPAITDILEEIRKV